VRGRRRSPAGTASQGVPFARWLKQALPAAPWHLRNADLQQTIYAISQRSELRPLKAQAVRELESGEWANGYLSPFAPFRRSLLRPIMVVHFGSLVFASVSSCRPPRRVVVSAKDDVRPAFRRWCMVT